MWLQTKHLWRRGIIGAHYRAPCKPLGYHIGVMFEGFQIVLGPMIPRSVRLSDGCRSACCVIFSLEMTLLPRWWISLDNLYLFFSILLSLLIYLELCCRWLAILIRYRNFLLVLHVLLLFFTCTTCVIIIFYLSTFVTCNLDEKIFLLRHENILFSECWVYLGVHFFVHVFVAVF